MDTNVDVPDFGDITPKKISTTPKVLVEMLLTDTKCFSQVKPFFMNGGVCDHKMMDLKGAVDIIKKFDTSEKLKVFKLKDKALGFVINHVMKTRYVMDKNNKIVHEYKPELENGGADAGAGADPTNV